MSEARNLVNEWLAVRCKKNNVPSVTIDEIIKSREKEVFFPIALISLAKFCNEKAKK